jgi:hypothetical protein
MSENTERKIPKLWYQAPNNFWMPDSRGKYICYSKSNVAKRLKLEIGQSNEKIEKTIGKALQKNVVDAVFAIGGMRKGLHQDGNKNILVPTEQRRIVPVVGEFPTIQEYLTGMLGEEQRKYFFGWLKVFLDGFYEYQQCPGQVLVMLGETSAGKSLLKDLLSEIFDGCGQPHEHLTGVTRFNGELCAASLLAVDDKLNDLGLQGMARLRATAKEIAVSGQLRFEFKNQTAFVAKPLQRLLICANYTEDSVSVVPELDESMRNKVSILDCVRTEMPMPTNTLSDRAKFWEKLVGELPHFIHFLRETYEIPAEFLDHEEKRMGVRAYHSPKAIDFMSNSQRDPEMREILQLLKSTLGESNTWIGSASDLAKIILPPKQQNTSGFTRLGAFLNRQVGIPSSVVKKISKRTYEITT